LSDPFQSWLASTRKLLLTDYIHNYYFSGVTMPPER